MTLRTAAATVEAPVAAPVLDLDLDRWAAPIDEADQTVLDRCAGPTLDVGCGPGRFVSALVRAGRPALGVDIAETAVALTRANGSPALQRSVFASLPGEGRWPTVLLMDGNIGIGGEPLTLLRRVRRLLIADGKVIVEANADSHADDTVVARLRHHGRQLGQPFDWAHVGEHALVRHASVVGFGVSERWVTAGRTFIEFACAA